MRPRIGGRCSRDEHPLDYWFEYTLEHTLHRVRNRFASGGRENEEESFSIGERKGHASISRNVNRLYERARRRGGSKPLDIRESTESTPSHAALRLGNSAGIAGGNAEPRKRQCSNRSARTFTRSPRIGKKNSAPHLSEHRYPLREQTSFDLGIPNE